MVEEQRESETAGEDFTRTQRWMGVAAALATFAGLLAYAVALAIGLMTLGK